MRNLGPGKPRQRPGRLGGAAPDPDHRSRLRCSTSALDCSPSIGFAIEQPNFADYNTYWPRKNSPVAFGEATEDGKTPQYKGLAEWTKATGHDLHSSWSSATPGRGMSASTR